MRAPGGPVSPSPSAIAPASPDAALAPRPLAPGSSACSALDLADVLDHAVDLTVTLAPPSLSATGVIRVRARRPTSEICFDARGLRISSATVEASPLPFRRDGDVLFLSLPAPLAPGDERSVRLAWAVPVDRETPHVGADEIWAGYGTSAWMPTLQDPAQRATLTLRLVTPPSTRAAASGRLVDVGTTADGRLVHTFRVDRPTPTFLYAFAAGRFDERSREVGGVGLRALGPPGVDLDAALTLTEPMLRFLHDRLGAAYPAPAYTQVFVRGEAAQEAAAMALVSASALDDVRRDPTEDWVFLHELSHQWVAWLVPCADFGDFWLNEGFASFLVAAYKEQRWGRSAYDREVQLWRRRSVKVHDEHRDAPVSLVAAGVARRAVRDADLQPRGVTYARGALVLHRLREELGEAVFWSAVRRYVADRAGRAATSEDLRHSLEAASGRDLTAFFARWVYAPAPDL